MDYFLDQGMKLIIIINRLNLLGDILEQGEIIIIYILCRLYFTSASHVYTLFNIIHLGLESKLVHTAKEKEYMNTITNLNYLS